MYETSSCRRSVPYVTIPQAAPGDVYRKLIAAVGASHPRVGVTVLVDASIEILQEREVGREQVLDHTGMHVIDITDVADHATDQHHREVIRVLTDPVVTLRYQFVSGRGQSHHTMAVNCSGRVDVPARQHEGELGSQPSCRLVRGSGPGASARAAVRKRYLYAPSGSHFSYVSTSFSVSTLVSPAFRSSLQGFSATHFRSCSA